MEEGKSLIDLDKILLPKSLIDLSSQRILTAEVETEGTSAVDGKNAAKFSFWTVRFCVILIDIQ